MSAEEIAAAEQRGREDNADHGMCLVFGSKALEVILDERDALRAQVERVRALAETWTAKPTLYNSSAIGGRQASYIVRRPSDDYADALRAALDGPQ